MDGVLIIFFGRGGGGGAGYGDSATMICGGF